jgi:hypothetical protein
MLIVVHCIASVAIVWLKVMLEKTLQRITLLFAW